MLFVFITNRTLKHLSIKVERSNLRMLRLVFGVQFVEQSFFLNVSRQRIRLSNTPCILKKTNEVRGGP